MTAFGESARLPNGKEMRREKKDLNLAWRMAPQAKKGERGQSHTSGTLIHKLTKMHSKRSSALQIAHEQLSSTIRALRESFFQVICVYLRRLSFYRLQNLFGDGLGAL